MPVGMMQLEQGVDEMTLDSDAATDTSPALPWTADEAKVCFAPAKP
jgi:hypothetical protein